MKKYLILLISLIVIVFSSCTENYSNGERIGLITQFSRSGLLFKSWEGHLNLTQTGMNSSSTVPFDFSIDRDNELTDVINRLDSAARFGWKVKLVYHETFGWNWFNNRGDTNHFITECEILDKNPVKSAFEGSNVDKQYNNVGRVVDTVYLVIVPKEKIKN